MAGIPIEGGFTVAMTRAADTPGIDIVDPIERRRCTLRTPEPVSPAEGDPDAFRFPVERAVDIETRELTAPFTGHAYVRNGDGDVVAEARNGFRQEFPDGSYSIELSGLIKVYVRFTGPFSMRNGFDGMELTFPASREVSIGSRSAHRRPAATITTTHEPHDLMAAISTFGSALKPTSPERSFPTLRGYPPALEVGETLEIPDGLEAPVDDVVIEVEPTYEQLFPVAPLAYYLGVPVTTGPVPRLVGEHVDHLLTHPDGFARAVHETLQRVFLLECVTRTEGLYPVDLLERERLEGRIDLPFDELYEASVDVRLDAFLEIPYRLIEDVVPDWRLAAHVEPTQETIPMLSHLANDLALVSIADGRTITSEPGAPIPAGTLVRGGATDTRGASAEGMALVESTGEPEALERAWVSEGMPVDATKAVLEAYENRIGRQPQTSSIDIAVVCNSPDMAGELLRVDGVYGDHEEMPFEVSMHEELTTGELEALIREDFNFFHYIGHIDDDGFRCPDGRLDMTGIGDVGPEAFFLNACQSYEQGLGLVRGGAVGGIVTLNDIVNHGAVRVGQTVGRLLNVGFPLRGALDLAATKSVIGRQYVAVGDGTLSIVQPSSGTPYLYEITPQGDEYLVRIDGFGAPPGMGCMLLPYFDDYNMQNLAGGKSRRIEMDRGELQTLLSEVNVPVRRNDELVWSDEFFD